MKSYDELKADIEIIQQQIVEVKESERTITLMKVEVLCNEFGLTAATIKGALYKGRKK